MKKIIALLLAAVMCLSLVACGGGETTNTDNSSGTQGSTVSATNNGETTITEPQSPGIPDGNTENPYADHAHLTYIYGQWELISKDSYQQDEEIPCSALTINKDGTCAVDGASGTWEFSDETRDNFLKINIFIEGEHRYTSGYYERSKSIGVWSAGYNGPVDSSWMNMSATEVITLTTDNWRDYFELVTDPIYENDAFGDLYSLSLIQYLVLKEEYAENIVYISDVVAEVTGQANSYHITIDAINKSYTLGDIIEGLEFAAKTRELHQNEGVYKMQVSGNNYITVANNANPVGPHDNIIALINDINNIEFLRVKGIIYITKR